MGAAVWRRPTAAAPARNGAFAENEIKLAELKKISRKVSEQYIFPAACFPVTLIKRHRLPFLWPRQPSAYGRRVPQPRRERLPGLASLAGGGGTYLVRRKRVKGGRRQGARPGRPAGAGATAKAVLLAAAEGLR